MKIAGDLAVNRDLFRQKRPERRAEIKIVETAAYPQKRRIRQRVKSDDNAAVLAQHGRQYRKRSA